MKLVCIRHSESLVNPNIPIDTWGLSEKGIALAKKLADKPDVQKIQIIYSSLQPKALETALYATKNRGVSLMTDTNLTEITSFTKKFVEISELEKNTNDFYSGKIERLYGGESKEEALERFNRTIGKIVADEKNKEYVGIVSHGAILAFFFAQFIDREPRDILDVMKQPDVAVLDWNTKKITSFFGKVQ